jgi:MFS transporter, ACS family, solute carrier family 17 (sodium-dependent inorganic phosphate cotransporter), other
MVLLRPSSAGGGGAGGQWRGLQPRHVIVGLCFLATFTAYVERVGFSIAFTSLARTVGFDEQVKGAVMSAFYWGYGVSQVRERG